MICLLYFSFLAFLHGTFEGGRLIVSTIAMVYHDDVVTKRGLLPWKNRPSVQNTRNCHGCFFCTILGLRVIRKKETL